MPKLKSKSTGTENAETDFGFLYAGSQETLDTVERMAIIIIKALSRGGDRSE